MHGVEWGETWRLLQRVIYHYSRMTQQWEIREWYVTPLTWVQQGEEEKVLAFAAQQGMEDFYAEKYLNTLRVGADCSSFSLLCI